MNMIERLDELDNELCEIMDQLEDLTLKIRTLSEEYEDSDELEGEFMDNEDLIGW